MIVKRVKQTFCAILGLISLTVTLYSLVKFILFMSKPMEHVKLSSGKETDEWKVALRHLLHNSIFAVVFILQHSFQKHPNVKSFWEKIGLKIAERSAYNLVSALILLQLTQSWTTVERWTLWHIKAESHSTIWWILVITHSILWTIIALGSLLMDLPEIFGIKQIYYDVQGLNDPFLYKARNLRRLLTSIRHPSYVGFSMIFWITNLMTLDRFILALLFTAYMYVAWSPDRADYVYQRQQFELKKVELSYDLKQS